MGILKTLLFLFGIIPSFTSSATKAINVSRDFEKTTKGQSQGDENSNIVRLVSLKDNLNGQSDCFCNPKPEKGHTKTVSQQVNPDNEIIERLVVYFYKVNGKNPNNAYIYIPNSNKQRYIPDLFIDKADLLQPTQLQHVLDLFVESPYKISSKVFGNIPDVSKILPLKEYDFENYKIKFEHNLNAYTNSMNFIKNFHNDIPFYMNTFSLFDPNAYTSKIDYIKVKPEAYIASQHSPIPHSTTSGSDNFYVEFNSVTKDTPFYNDNTLNSEIYFQPDDNNIQKYIEINNLPNTEKTIKKQPYQPANIGHQDWYKHQRPLELTLVEHEEDIFKPNHILHIPSKTKPLQETSTSYDEYLLKDYLFFVDENQNAKIPPMYIHPGDPLPTKPADPQSTKPFHDVASGTSNKRPWYNITAKDQIHEVDTKTVKVTAQKLNPSTTLRNPFSPKDGIVLPTESYNDFNNKHRYDDQGTNNQSSHPNIWHVYNSTGNLRDISGQIFNELNPKTKPQHNCQTSPNVQQCHPSSNNILQEPTATNEQSNRQFDSWLDGRIKEIGIQLQKDEPELNLYSLKLLIEGVLRDHNFTIDDGGVLFNGDGKMVVTDELKLRPIMIGNAVAYKNLLDSPEQKLQIKRQTPYFQGLLVSAGFPSKVLSIIPLGVKSLLSTGDKNSEKDKFIMPTEKNLRLLTPYERNMEHIKSIHLFNNSENKKSSKLNHFPKLTNRFEISLNDLRDNNYVATGLQNDIFKYSSNIKYPEPSITIPLPQNPLKIPTKNPQQGPLIYNEAEILLKFFDFRDPRSSQKCLDRIMKILIESFSTTHFQNFNYIVDVINNDLRSPTGETLRDRILTHLYKLDLTTPAMKPLKDLLKYTLPQISLKQFGLNQHQDQNLPSYLSTSATSINTLVQILKYTDISKLPANLGIAITYLRNLDSSNLTDETLKDIIITIFYYLTSLRTSQNSDSIPPRLVDWYQPWSKKNNIINMPIQLNSVSTDDFDVSSILTPFKTVDVKHPSANSLQAQILDTTKSLNGQVSLSKIENNFEGARKFLPTIVIPDIYSNLIFQKYDDFKDNLNDIFQYEKDESNNDDYSSFTTKDYPEGNAQGIAEFPQFRIIGGHPATGSGTPLNNKGRLGIIT